MSGAGGLLNRAGVEGVLDLEPSAEHAWIEVIHKMDAVYADLVRYQVELEEKNAALEETQQFVNSVLSSMTDVLIVCDVQGNIQRVNHALEQITGHSEAELLHKPIGCLFGDRARAQVESLPDKLGAEQIIDCEVNLVDSEGRDAPLAMNCSSRYDYDGRLLGMVLIGRPVGELRRAYDRLNQAHSELKEAQQQLVQSEKMASLGRLVAGVAHELNNPISFVFGNMYALQRYAERIKTYIDATREQQDAMALAELRDQLKLDHVLQDIQPLIEGSLEGAERVSEIVQDLRRFSGGQQEQAVDYDLVQVVRTATNWVLKAARVKPEVNYRLPESVTVNGRKGHVHQILVNLIQNAVDVMENLQQPLLDIACQEKEGNVEVIVRDHGPGIAQQDIDQIFEPFFTTKPVGKGTGLGLYISYGLARDQGGELKVENHCDGGAMFTLNLPKLGQCTA